MIWPTRLTEEMVQRFMAEGLWTQETMVSMLRRLPAGRREALAASDAHRRLTWAEMDTESLSVGEGLRGLGLKRGDLVLVQLPNLVENLVVRYALKRVGILGVYVPVVWREIELHHVLQSTGARAIVSPTKFLDMNHRDMFQRLQSEFQDLQFGLFVRPGSAEKAGTICWDELVARGGGGEDREAFQPWEVSLLSVSSGSTGDPKLCEWPEGAQLLTGRGLADRLKVTPEDVIGICCPLDGGAGAMAWLTAVSAGVRMVLAESFRASDILETIERERVTIMSTVPTILLRILDLPDLSRWDLSSLRLIRTGTAALLPRIARDAEQRLGAKVVPAAGSMETITFTQTSPDDPPGTRLGGYVGRPLPGGEVRIVANDGTPASAGEPGMLEIRGAYTGSGYFRDRENTRAAWGTLGPEGWFRTGDLALMTADGNISIVGRAKEVIVRGGRNVIPSELEAILLQHNAVREAVVVGVPHERLGEATRACIVRRNGQDLSADEVRGFLKSRQMATYKILDEICFLAELPRLPGGKVNRRELSSRALQPE